MSVLAVQSVCGFFLLLNKNTRISVMSRAIIVMSYYTQIRPLITCHLLCGIQPSDVALICANVKLVAMFIKSERLIFYVPLHLVYFTRVDQNLYRVVKCCASGSKRLYTT